MAHETIPDGIELTPYDPEFYNDPHSVYRRLRTLDPVHKDKQSFYENSWTISDHQIVRKLLTHPDLSVDARTIGLRRDPRADNSVTLREPNMMNLDGMAHRRLRKLVERAFTAANVKAFMPELERIASACLSQIDSATVDIVEVLSNPLPTIAIAKFIGIDSQRHQDFKRWTQSLTKQGFPMPTEQQWQEIVTADSELRTYLSDIIEDRPHELHDDLVSRLILDRDNDQKLTTEEIVEMCFLLIGAGNFTTTDLISNSIHAYLLSDRQSSSAEIVRQTLMDDPPVLAVRRYVISDINIAGKQIEKGSVINLLIGAASQDEVAANTLAFGHGKHHCLGSPLAQVEAEIALETFRTHYPNAILTQSTRSKRLDFRGFRHLEVELQPTLRS